MDKLTKFGNFLRSHSPFAFQSKKGVHTSSSGKVGSSQQVKRNFSEDVFTMKNLLNKPSASNAKKFNAIANDAFYSSFADEAKRKNFSSIEILKRALGIDSMNHKELEKMVISFEEANRKGQLNDYDPLMASMFFEAMKTHLAEESERNPGSGYDIFAIRIQKIITDITTTALRQTGVKMEKLGSGAFNTAYKFETGNPPKTMIFRPENPGIKRKIGKETVDEAGARREERNVLASRLDRKLGFDVVPQTEFAHINGERGIIMEKAPGHSQLTSHTYAYKPLPDDKIKTMHILQNPQNYYYSNSDKGWVLTSKAQESLRKILGVSDVQVQLTPGTNPYRFPAGADPYLNPNFKLVVTVHVQMPKDPLDPNYQRESAQLGLLDRIIGQTDRHPENIKGGKGIDNDGGWLENLPKLHMGLPRVVDAQMKASIEKLSEDDLRAMLVGYLTDGEIEAAVERLGQVKTHLKEGIESGKVQLIEPDEWGTEKIKGWLCTPETNEAGNEVWTSYLGRDINLNKDFARQGMKIMTPEQFEKNKKLMNYTPLPFK